MEFILAFLDEWYKTPCDKHGGIASRKLRKVLSALNVILQKNCMQTHLKNTLSPITSRKKKSNNS